VELPEVEVIRRDMEKEVVGRKIKTVDVRPSKNAKHAIRRHKVRKEFVEPLQGRKVAKLERRGATLLLYLDSDDVLVVSFGPGGQFIRGTKRQPTPPHTHVIFTFQQGGDLRFVDAKNAGELFVTDLESLSKLKEFSYIPIDPLENTFTWPAFGATLAQTPTKLKLALMDPKLLAGLGMIYSDEVMFHAGLRFDRQSNTLSSQEVRRLYRAIQEVVQDAIKHRGTTLEEGNYLDLFGEPGNYQKELKVYGRAGLPCRRCRNEIVTARVSQKLTYFCEQCQS